MKSLKALDRLLAAAPVVGAVALMVMAGGFLSGQHGIVRYLARDLHPFEIVFFRNLFGFVAFLPWLLKAGPAGLRTARFGTHVLRAACNASSLMAYFTALSLIPLADAAALFLTVPLLVAFGAALVLGEGVRPQRWIALAIGCSGALVIIRPGFETIGLGNLLVIAAAGFAAGTRLMAKSLSRTDRPSAIVAYVTLLMTPVTLVPALFVWQWPGGADLLWLLAIGLLGSAGQLSFVKAYSLVDVSFAEPMAFTRLVWAAAIGFFAFAEVPDLWTWVGGALIVAGTTYVARRDLAARRGAR